MRNTVAKELSLYAENGEDFIVLTADLGYSVFDNFSQNNPEKFYNMGIAENTSVGVAAGLALGGKRVLVYSISAFLVNKCFEQIRDDICYHDLPVVLIGTGSGFSYGHAGYSHFSIEDVALLRTIPNLTIISPSDPHELAMLLRDSATYKHPVYFRIGKNGEKTFNKHREIRIGNAYFITEEKDIAIISHGNIIEESVRAGKLLNKAGFNVSIISCPTIKPLDKKFFTKLVKSHSYLYLVEEHSEIGGLGDALSEFGAISIAVPDKIFYTGGDQKELRKRAGIDGNSIYKRISRDLSKVKL